MVDGPLVVLRGDEAERDPEDDGEEAGRDRQLDRRGKALPELRRRPAARDVELVPKLQRRQLLHVLAVLDVDRLVEAVLVLDRRDGLRRRPLAEERRGRPARERPDPEEDQDRDARGGSG